MVEDKFLINFNENIENENFDIQINHLNCSQQSKIDKLIQKNKSVFKNFKNSKPLESSKHKKHNQI